MFDQAVTREGFKRSACSWQAYCRFTIAADTQRVAEIIMQLGDIRSDSRSFAVVIDRLVPAPDIQQYAAQIGMSFEVVGFQSQRALVGLYGLVIVLYCAIGICERLAVGRLCRIQRYGLVEQWNCFR
jgi:hypothetical protein